MRHRTYRRNAGVIVICKDKTYYYKTISIAAKALSTSIETIENHIANGKPDRQGRFYDLAIDEDTWDEMA